MSPWPARRRIDSVRLLTQLGAEYGLTLDSCLRHTGLEATTLLDSQRMVNAEQELQVVTNLIQGYGGYQPELGLKAGRRYHLSTYGIWGYALLSSPTLRAAIDIGLRYMDLTFAFVRAYLTEGEQDARLIMDESAIPPLCQQFLLERDLSSIMTMVVDLFNLEAPIRQVTFKYPKPQDVTPYQQAFGLTPLFDQPDNSISFDRFFLDVALAQANPVLAKHCEQACRDLLNQRQQRSGLAEQVRNLLLAQPGHLPSMERIAEELHISSRTLRRQLDTENLSFRQLVAEVRMGLAAELLTLPSMTLDEIAERLGYAETASFMHAFKRWYGKTPRQFQAR